MAIVESHIETSVTTDDVSDGQLLAEVACSGSNACFELLVRRHGPMVRGVCQRLLRDVHEADDAAQAVFLVLWKKAGKLRRHSCLAGWLHQVTRNVCLHATRARAIRDRHEGEAAQMAEQFPSQHELCDEIEEALDAELDGLVEKYRLPIILFHLEGRTLKEIATLLDTKVSTIGMRLNRGRELLRSRLARRGITTGVAALATTLTVNTCSAAVPTALYVQRPTPPHCSPRGNLRPAERFPPTPSRLQKERFTC